MTAPNAASFTCSASGVPRPNITWVGPDSATLMSVDDGVVITDTEQGDRERISTLNITRTAPSVGGQYRCLADNGVTGVGNTTTSEAMLIVNGIKPIKFTLIRPGHSYCIFLFSVSDGDQCVP